MKRSIRQQEIYNILRQDKYISINILAERFNVTTATIRRDLKALEQDNIVERSHGHAQLKEDEDSSTINSFNERASVNDDEKRRIAQAARALIEPRDSIIMDSGTTVYQLAVELAANPVRDISVITNSVAVGLKLAENSNNYVTLTSGILEAWHLALIGPDAEAYYSSISATKVFIGATGASGGYLTANNPFHVSIKKKMIERSENIIAMIDSAKFNVSATHAFCDFSKISTLITVKTEQNEEIIQKLIDEGVNVVLA